MSEMMKLALALQVLLALTADCLLADDDDSLQWLRDSVPGEPGLDYPILSSPQTSQFSCSGRVFGGYYADVQQRCQVYHVCLHRTQVAFLCPNGTTFNQDKFVCDWWFNVDCQASNQHFSAVQGAFGGEGYVSGSGSGSGSGSSCPAVSGGDCSLSVSTCWSPGQRDRDCPGSGLCCFDGCANTCAHSPQAQTTRHPAGASTARPRPPLTVTTTTTRPPTVASSTARPRPPPTFSSTTSRPRPTSLVFTTPAVTTWRPVLSTEEGGYLYPSPPDGLPTLYVPPLTV